MYFKLGFNWFISQDHEDLSNGFYTGLRFAYAMYNQTVNEYPIRLSNNQVYDYGSFPTENVSAYWAEIVLGARVRLLSNFYVDFSVRDRKSTRLNSSHVANSYAVFCLKKKKKKKH